MSMNKDSNWYIQSGGKKIIVSEAVFREYMRMVWREQKQWERQNRCPRPSGVGVCRKDCSSCLYERQPVEFSLEALQESADIESPVLVEEIYCQKEQYDSLWQAVDTLTEKEKQVVFWFSQGMSQREMARQLSLSTARICQIKSRAFRKLKNILYEWA